jgi:hypothetical protein
MLPLDNSFTFSFHKQKFLNLIWRVCGFWTGG